jgi:hypothetical protein
MMAATRTLLPVGPNMPRGPLPGKEDEAFSFVSFEVININLFHVCLSETISMPEIFDLYYK